MDGYNVCFFLLSSEVGFDIYMLKYELVNIGLRGISPGAATQGCKSNSKDEY